MDTEVSLANRWNDCGRRQRFIADRLGPLRARSATARQLELGEDGIVGIERWIEAPRKAVRRATGGRRGQVARTITPGDGEMAAADHIADFRDGLAGVKAQVRRRQPGWG